MGTHEKIASEEPPPISRNFERALGSLARLRDELADRAACAHAAELEQYHRLAPGLDHLERFREDDEESIAELRALLIRAQELRDDMARN